jgi:hypothetical protein
MDVDHWRIEIKISDLHSQKAIIGHMIIEKIATKPEAAIRTEATVGADFKTSLSTACSMKETLTIGQEIFPSSWNPKRKLPKDIASHRQQQQPKKLTIHLTGINLHNHPPQTNLHTKTSILVKNTNQIIIDTPRNTTNHITTPHIQANFTHPNQQSPTLQHHCK